MKNLDKLIDQAYSDLKPKCGGVRNDYFGLIYLENEFDIPQDKAINQIGFGGTDYGIDGFHFDKERKNLYIFQFKYSNSYATFKETLHRLIDIGIEVIFSNPAHDRNKNQILNQLRSCLIENKEIIKQICFRFIFIGDPEEAERSQVLDKLREDLENKKYLINEFFEEQQVSLVVEFKSFSGKVGQVSRQIKTHSYLIPINKLFSLDGPNNEVLHIGVISLFELYGIYKDMQIRFFERNIRYGLGSEEAVNRALLRTFKSIILEKKEDPKIFTFNHNGITLYCEALSEIDSKYKISSPRVLNGAQTITTFYEFIEKNMDNPKYRENIEIAKSINVLCKFITNANQNFVTNVTINNNRQNPVEPWNLHANDMIQLQLQDKFRDDLKIGYERQENAFNNIDLDEEGIIDNRPIELFKLAQTFLISDGNIQRLSKMRQVFDEDNIYSQVFNESRLKADSRFIVLCYKIPFRLPRLLRDILEKGQNKYAYVPKARLLLWALLCQAVLNDEKLNKIVDQFGADMKMPADYTEYLSYLATNKCRHLLSELINDEKFKDKAIDGNYSFLKTNTAFDFCMDVAYNKWKWVHKKIK